MRRGPGDRAQFPKRAVAEEHVAHQADDALLGSDDHGIAGLEVGGQSTPRHAGGRLGDEHALVEDSPADRPTSFRPAVKGPGCEFGRQVAGGEDATAEQVGEGRSLARLASAGRTVGMVSRVGRVPPVGRVEAQGRALRSGKAALSTFAGRAGVVELVEGAADGFLDATQGVGGEGDVGIGIEGAGGTGEGEAAVLEEVVHLLLGEVAAVWLDAAGEVQPDEGDVFGGTGLLAGCQRANGHGVSDQPAGSGLGVRDRGPGSGAWLVPFRSAVVF